MSSRTFPQPSNLTAASGTPIHRSVAITIYLGTVSKAFPGRRTPEPYCPVPPVSSLPSVSGLTSRLLFLSPFWTNAVLPRSNLLFFLWSLRLKPSPTVSVLGWGVWFPCTFLYHSHPLFSTISALSGIRYPSILHTHVQYPSSHLSSHLHHNYYLVALHLPLSPCLSSSCALLFPLIPVLSPTLPPLS